jgi:putative transposase
VAAVRYVERNPVRAGLVRVAWRWPWSSAAGHVEGRPDALVTANPLAEEIGDWRRFLRTPDDEEVLETMRRHGRTGRPWGEPTFLARLESRLGRRLLPGRPGRPPRAKGK